MTESVIQSESFPMFDSNTSSMLLAMIVVSAKWMDEQHKKNKQFIVVLHKQNPYFEIKNDISNIILNQP